jgi:CheY-like chemotaxis protein
MRSLVAWKRRSRSALPTTVTELAAMAAAASTGGQDSGGGQWYEEQVVAEGPAEVLADDLSGGAGEHDRVGDRADAAVDQGDVGCGHGRAGAGGDRDADVGRGEGGFDRDGADLVLLDLMLPEPPGIEVCRSLRWRSDVPVIMLSARGDRD